MEHRSTEAMLAEYARTGDPGVRDAVIERHRGLVWKLATKFARPGVPADDLAQAGWVALIRALDRFDPARRVKFSTYAVSCVVGEIKRYFRDRTWAIRVPRKLREVAANLHRKQDRLHCELQREPTVQEMAAAFGVTEEEVLEAMELYRAYEPLPLGQVRENDEGDRVLSIGEQYGAEDPELTSLVDFAPLHDALEGLDERDQRILRLRFWGGWSQIEVARELELSQMHISRLERQALHRLRRELARSGAVAGAGRAAA